MKRKILSLSIVMCFIVYGLYMVHSTSTNITISYKITPDAFLGMKNDFQSNAIDSNVRDCVKNYISNHTISTINNTELKDSIQKKLKFISITDMQFLQDSTIVDN